MMIWRLCEVSAQEWMDFVGRVSKMLCIVDMYMC